MTMLFDFLRSMVSRRPGWVIGFWLALTAVVGGLAPNLTRLAAQGQARTLDSDAECVRAAELIARAWPEQSYRALAVAVLHRPGGLTATDRAFARALADRLSGPERPRVVLRVLGPGSPAEVADRLVSRDGTVQLVAVPLSEAFVGPASQRAVEWLERQARAVPDGLEVGWTGDAVIGRDYMANVQTSLHRAAVATVALLLVVLLVVYRSVWLALVPLTTIGASLVIARGLLAWLAGAGWELSPLVELFLIAVLFGSGTDFCLFVSWRYGEHWNPTAPGRAMRLTLARSALALLTSAGTVIIGLSLMGTTRFALFSRTGPSVALGLALTLAATMTLTPALLVVLARHRPRSFAGLSAPSSGVWERFARATLKRPALSWAATLVVLAPLAVIGLRTHFVRDMVLEMPAPTQSAATLRLLTTKFPTGMLAPLTVVLESPTDLHASEGLELIDDVSRFLATQRRLVEVRSATQPLGSSEPLERARLAARLGAVNEGFGQLADGAGELQKGLSDGVTKLRAAMWMEKRLKPNRSNDGRGPGAGAHLKETSVALRQTGVATTTKPQGPTAKAEDPRAVLLGELTRATEGAGRLADGAARARAEVEALLRDPVGRRALDRLLITSATVHDHPELLESFAVYITPDGHAARFDVTSAERVLSGASMDQVVAIRQRLNDYLGHRAGPEATAAITGANAEAADVRALTAADQFQSWFIVPIGVFLVLIVALRDPLASLNLVATMLLTYAVALGATHLLFVSGLGAEGIDWKVPYFLFVLMIAIGVDYNVFLMDRVRQETGAHGLRTGLSRAVAHTGGLITSAAAITACSFASFLFSPLGSLRQLGFALVVGITIDALLVRPLLVPCGHWLLNRHRHPAPAPPRPTDESAPSPTTRRGLRLARALGEL